MPGDETEAILYYSKHILFHKLLAFSLIDLLLRLVQFLQADHLILRIIQAKMGVRVHGYSYVRMPHKVLKSFWVHSGSCHIAAVGMPADMRRDVRKLYAEDVVVSLDCVLETVFPVQGYKQQAPVISEKDVEDLVVLAVYIIVVNELEEVLHLLWGNGFPGLFSIDDDPGQLETERILHQHVIVYRHLECRTKDTTDSFHGA